MKLKHLFMLCLFGIISIAANAEDIPNNEIWYTSSDGSIIEPYVSNVFGAALLTNEYKNEKGVITFNGDVTTIGELAFIAREGLTSIKLPNSVKKIEMNAFSHCSDLKSIDIPNSVTSIGVSAFEYCEALTSVSIPASVKRIGDSAFDICLNLKSVSISNSVETIGKQAFSGCRQLQSINLPNSITTISDYAFSDCYRLESITIPSSVTSLSEDAFKGCFFTIDNFINNSRFDPEDFEYWGARICTEITDAGFCLVEDVLLKYRGFDTEVIIPNNIRAIESNAFSGFKNLTNVTLPKSLETIGNSAFSYCESLKSINIPRTVTRIGEKAFDECNSLTSVYVNWTESTEIPTISYNTFPNASNCCLIVPEGTVDLYKAKYYWKDFKGIYDKEYKIDITNNDNSDGSLYLHDGSELALNDNIKSIAIEEEITNIDVTYTRNFEKAGVWQAWYMPFDVAFDDMKDAYDVAQIHGVLLDKDNNAVIAFLKLDGGTVKANTPYVVRPKASGDVAIETTTDLQPTMSKSFDLKSATDIYYLGGVYEQTTTPGNWYALNLDGQFQLMDNGVYLRPFRIYMTIDPRDDNPYSTSANANAKMDIVVIGDDEPTGINNLQPSTINPQPSLYNLNGQRVTSITSGQIYIMNGKKYIAK